jgi:hypothetical protein
MIIQKGEENIVEKMMSELQDFTAKTPFQPLFLNYSNQTRDRQPKRRGGWLRRERKEKERKEDKF